TGPAQRRLQEGPRVLDRLVDGRTADDRAPTAHQLIGAEGPNRVEGGARPVSDMGVSHVRRGLRFNEVAREQDAFLGEPDDQVTRRVATTEKPQLDLSSANLEAQRVLESMRRARQAGDGVGALEEARHAALLARPVL